MDKLGSRSILSMLAWWAACLALLVQPPGTFVVAFMTPVPWLLPKQHSPKSSRTDMEDERQQRPRASSFSSSSSSTPWSLRAGGRMVDDFFDNIGKLFGKVGNERSAYTDFTTGTCIFKIKAKSMKTGGLRLFLTLHLMGLQNTPDKGTWKCNQSEEGDLDMYYRDRSGAITVEFDSDGGGDDSPMISVYRQGSSPSTAFMMQEGLILQSVLDELDSVANAEGVAEADRLLVLEESGDTIEKARESISFA